MLQGTDSLKTIILPESFSNVTIDADHNLNPNGFWKSDDIDSILGTEISLGGTYTKTKGIATAGVDAYAMFYSDGYLVFQYGNQADPEHRVESGTNRVNLLRDPLQM